VRCSGAEGQKLPGLDVMMDFAGGEPDRPLQDLEGDGTRCVVLGHGFPRSQGDQVDPKRSVPDEGAAASAVGLLPIGRADALLFGPEMELKGLAREGSIDGCHGGDLDRRNRTQGEDSKPPGDRGLFVVSVPVGSTPSHRRI